MRKRSLVLMGLLLPAMALFAFGPGVRADTGSTEVTIVVSPSTVALESQGVWVTVHAEIPYSVVVGLTVSLNGIPVDVTKADNRGELVAKFALDDVKDILEVGTATLTLSGMTSADEPFTGTDTIQVISGGKK